MENYESERDRNGLDDLIRAVAKASAPSLAFLRTTSAGSFDVPSDNIEQAHFVVRNSSTKALYGFCATYYIKDTGIVGALFVEPTKRNISIGRSLHRRALRHLLQHVGIQKVQLGTAYPCVFPGIPVDEGGALKSWFASSGWDTQFPRTLTTMMIKDISSWTAPDGLTQSITRAGINFDLIHGLDNAESVLSHVNSLCHEEVAELYTFALHETKTCGVVRAKNAAGNIVGSVIICSPGSTFRLKVPCLQGAFERELVGGIVAPLVEPSAQAALVLQGLAYMGVRQNKAHKASRSVLSWVTDDSDEALLGMGFQVLQSFEEITNSPDNVSAMNQWIQATSHNECFLVALAPDRQKYELTYLDSGPSYHDVVLCLETFACPKL